MQKQRRCLRVGAAMLALCAAAAMAQAQGGATGSMDARTNDLWQRHWRRFAMKMVAFDSGFVAMPSWEPRFPSSRHMTPDMYRKANTLTMKQQFSGAMSRKIEIVPPEEEGRLAAMALPAMETGQYGYIHSAQVEEVLGPEEMIVSDTWLIDDMALKETRKKYEQDLRSKSDGPEVTQVTEKMFGAREEAASRQKDRAFRAKVRLVGFPTKGLHEGDRWPRKATDLSVAIAIVRGEAEGGKRSVKRLQLVAVPVEWFHKNLTEDQFQQMLKSRGLDAASFVELVTQTFRDERDEDEAVGRVFAELERRRVEAESQSVEAGRSRP